MNFETTLIPYLGKPAGTRIRVLPHMRRKYEEIGLIESSPIGDATDVDDSRTVEELKDELRARGLRVSGTKPELIERLAAAEEE